MSRGENYKKDSLADKLAGYSPEPPASVWEGVSSQIQKRKSRRLLFILLATAASLALAISVSLMFILPQMKVEVAQLEQLEQRAGEKGAGEQGAGEQGSREQGRREQGRMEERAVEIVSEIIEKEQVGPFGELGSLVDGGSNSADRGSNSADRGSNSADSSGNSVEGVEESIGEFGNRGEMSVEEAEEVLRELAGDEGILDTLSDTGGSIASSGNEVKREQGSWELGASVSPQYSYRDVASPDIIQNTKANSSESGRITYSTGIHVSYLPNDRLTIESGIYYNKMGVNIGDYSVFSFLEGWKELDMVYAPDPNGRNDQLISMSNSIGTIVTSDNVVVQNSYGGTGVANDYHLMSPENMSVNGQYVDYLSQSFEYLEIPLNVRYKIYDKDLVIQLIGGVSTNFLVHNSIDAVTNDIMVNIGEVQNVRLVNYSGTAGLGFLYGLFDNLTLRVEPRLRYYLHSINTSSLPSTRPYAFGLQTGLSYSF